MVAVAHTAQGFSDQELDRIEAALATMQTWLEMWRDNDTRTWGDVAALRSVADRLESVEDYWNAGAADAENVEAQEDESGFPFPAWDLPGQQAVTVLGYAPRHPGCYRIEPGSIASVNSITTVFPYWYTRAQEQLEAEHDERETLGDVRCGGCK